MRGLPSPRLLYHYKSTNTLWPIGEICTNTDRKSDTLEVPLFTAYFYIAGPQMLSKHGPLGIYPCILRSASLVRISRHATGITRACVYIVAIHRVGFRPPSRTKNAAVRILPCADITEYKESLEHMYIIVLYHQHIWHIVIYLDLEHFPTWVTWSISKYTQVRVSVRLSRYASGMTQQLLFYIIIRHSYSDHAICRMHVFMLMRTSPSTHSIIGLQPTTTELQYYCRIQMPFLSSTSAVSVSISHASLNTHPSYRPLRIVHILSCYKLSQSCIKSPPRKLPTYSHHV